MLDFAINNETEQGLAPIPFLINNIILRRYDAMTSNQIPLFSAKSQDGNLCECGCGGVTKPGNRFIHNHHVRGKRLSEAHKRSISKTLMGHTFSEETRRKISKTLTGCKQPHQVVERRAQSNTGKKRTAETRLKMRNAQLGKPVSDETKVKLSIINYKGTDIPYCGAWYDRDYREDLRKKTCFKCGITNMMCVKLFGARLSLHHIDGDKFNCNPSNFMTLCTSCHKKEDMKLIKIKRLKQQEV